MRKNKPKSCAKASTLAKAKARAPLTIVLAPTNAKASAGYPSPKRNALKKAAPSLMLSQPHLPLMHQLCSSSDGWIDARAVGRNVSPLDPDLPPNLAVFSTTYIFVEQLSILEVRHESDEDGGATWEFHANNGDYSLSKFMLVALSEVIARDTTIASILNLPIDHVALRENVGGEWKIATIRNAVGLNLDSVQIVNDAWVATTGQSAREA
jgi:hypothetical protein